jgi:hypothetical protein
VPKKELHLSGRSKARGAQRWQEMDQAPAAFLSNGHNSASSLCNFKLVNLGFFRTDVHKIFSKRPDSNYLGFVSPKSLSQLLELKSNQR